MSDPLVFGTDSRLRDGPATALTASAFMDELRAAPYVLPWLGIADLAHVAMLVRAGIIEPLRARRLLEAFLDLDERNVEVPLDPHRGDLYNNRDAFLEARLGKDAGYVHAGRARREATTLAWQLACRERIAQVGTALVAVIDALTTLARAHRRTVMPDYTYLVGAQPTTLGHYLLGFVYPLLRDHDRLVAAYAVVNRSPAGSGSVNGSRYAFDREWVASLLQFDSVIVHTRDAMWAPDMATEQLYAIMTTFTNLDRLVEDLQIWTTSEFGFVELDDRHARASVIMPQKKNPYSLAWVRGRARFFLGRSLGVVGTFLTPSGQPDNRITAYVEVPAALDDAAACLVLVADVVRHLRVDVARMSAAARAGYLYATDLCDLLVEQTGIDNRSAHRIVGYAIRECIAAKRSELTRADLTHAAGQLDIPLEAVDAETFADALRPESLVGLRKSLGGSAEQPMDYMFGQVDELLVEARSYWEHHPPPDFHTEFRRVIRMMIKGLS
jgi:argininosuccinate lyase